MSAYEIEAMIGVLIWAMRQKDPQDPRIKLFELFRIVNRLNKLATEDEALREPIIKELMNHPWIKTLFKLAFEKAMEDPTIRDDLVKRVKGLDPQSIAYLMIPEAVKNSLKD